MTALSLFGLTISLAVLGANLRTWWKSPGRDPKTLGPFAGGFTLGALATVCAGGVLGLLAGCGTDLTNTAGGRAVGGTTGSTDSTLASGTLGTLTPEGAMVVFLLTVGVVITWRAAGKEIKRRMAGGLLCGATLCATAGIASLLNWLPGTANAIGQGIRAAVEGGGIL